MEHCQQLLSTYAPLQLPRVERGPCSGTADSGGSGAGRASPPRAACLRGLPCCLWRRAAVSSALLASPLCSPDQAGLLLYYPLEMVGFPPREASPYHGAAGCTWPASFLLLLPRLLLSSVPGSCPGPRLSPRRDGQQGIGAVLRGSSCPACEVLSPCLCLQGERGGLAACSGPLPPSSAPPAQS